MISFETYRVLPQAEQAEILERDGVYPGLIRSTSQWNIELYCLYDFYAEVFFDKATGEPQFLRSFCDTKGLNAYLPLIGIDELFQEK